MLRGNKDDINKTHAYLKSIYKHIREAYKYYSSVAPSGTIFSIGTNVFSDIIYNCEGVLDGKYMKLSDVDLEFVSTNAGYNRNKTQHNPDR